MSQPMLLVRLRQHQDLILALLRGAEPLLVDPGLRDVATLGRMRWALMRALTAYSHFKHGEIFDPAIARQTLGDLPRADRMKQACIAMGNDFRGYVTKWSGADVAGEWASYQPAALAMMARLREHLASERREIETLLSKAA